MSSPTEPLSERYGPTQYVRRIARVLLADSDLASRLALKSLLTAAGYAVDSAACAAEAVGKLDCAEYQLVLADLRAESPEAGARTLAYARQKEYGPATALISSDMISSDVISSDKSAVDVNVAERFVEDHPSEERLVRMSDENVSYLLDRAADLISHRADRRSRLAVRKAS